MRILKLWEVVAAKTMLTFLVMNFTCAYPVHITKQLIRNLYWHVFGYGFTRVCLLFVFCFFCLSVSRICTKLGGGVGYGLMTNLFSFGADPVKGADPGNTFFSFSVTLGIELCFFFF